MSDANTGSWCGKHPNLRTSSYNDPMDGIKGALSVSEYIVPEEYWILDRPVRIKRMEQRNGLIKWKVTNGGEAGFRPDVGGFATESTPSSRKDETLKHARFDTVEEAFLTYVKWHKETEFNEQGYIVDRATVEPTDTDQ